MEETLFVRDLKSLYDASNKIVEKLTGKTFDVVSFHSGNIKNNLVLENASLKDGTVYISITMARIFLSPRRSICFDVIEKPRIVFVSERQIVIIRQVKKNDLLIKIILINGQIESDNE